MTSTFEIETVYDYKLVKQPCSISVCVEFFYDLIKRPIDGLHKGDRLPAHGYCKGLRFPDKLYILDGSDVFGRIHINNPSGYSYERIDLRCRDFKSGLPYGCLFNIAVDVDERGYVSYSVAIPSLKRTFQCEKLTFYQNSICNNTGEKLQHYKMIAKRIIEYPVYECSDGELPF